MFCKHAKPGLGNTHLGREKKGHRQNAGGHQPGLEALKLGLVRRVPRQTVWHPASPD